MPIKSLLILVCLLLTLSGSSLAQATTATSQSASIVDQQALPIPIADSTQQAVHKIFKWGRRLSWAAAVSGGLVTYSGISYTARGDGGWRTGIDMVTGGYAAFIGVQGIVRFNRRHERQVLAALAQGQPVPPYVAQWLLYRKR
ncbi:hypothetical protein MUN82_07565 [Hymenobacter aerilatus]|uniref:Uncharacterized protein n=1 Tax=Hymenobacter aerilatus TaxID=2932251 RepID=A0A8T9T2Z5_9BACT|nr:hypothetical protein [Hymenobacter aerilatus]UOR06950.1 hypothetical protein MUN82_07565 [Hymenobacter aerilatus]